MRKLAIVFGIVVLLVAVAAGAILLLVDVNQYRPQIQSRLEQSTGRQVSLGKMDLKLFPLAFRVDNAIIFEDSAFADSTVPSQQPFAQTRELLVSVKLLPLISKRVEISSLELSQPKIELIRNQRGDWNFSTLGKTTQAQPTRTEAISLDRLLVADGQLALTDLKENKPRRVYDHIDLSVQDIASDSPMTLDLTAHLPGKGKQEVRLTGKGGPFASGKIESEEFDGKLQLTDVSLSGIQQFLDVKALEGVEFSASGDTAIKLSQNNLKSSGALTLRDGVVHGTSIGYPVSADYLVSGNLKDEIYNIEKCSLKLGATPVSIAGSIDTANTPAKINLNLTASNESISDAARLAAAFGVAFSPGMQVSGKMDANVKASGPASRPVMNGTLALREVAVTGKDLPQAVNISSIQLALSPQQVRSNEFTATTGSTAVNASFVLSDYSGDNPAIEANLKAANAQIAELIRIAQAYGVQAAAGISGTGTASIDVHAQGGLKNPGGLSLAGDGTLMNASLTLPSLHKPVQVKNANLKFSQNSATVENLQATVGSTNASGQVMLKGLAQNTTPQLQFNLAVDRFDLVEWQAILGRATQPAVKSAGLSSLVQVVYAAETNQPSFVNQLVGSGNLQIGTLIFDKLQMTSVKAAVTLDHGLIKLSPLTAVVYGGSSTGIILVDMRQAISTYSIQTKLDKVDANQTLSAISTIKNQIFGQLAASGSLGFTSSTSSDTARTLNGKINLNLQNGKLQGLNILNLLAALGQFLGGQQSNATFTNLQKVNGDFDIQNGIARTGNLTAVVDGGTLAGAGAINLGDQSLNMQLVAVLTKEYSQSVGGNQIGGYLTTVLSNNKGEMVMPILVSGTFAAPKITPDYKTIATMKLNNLVPALGGILDSLSSGKKSGAEGQQKTNIFSDILGALGGKQPADDPQKKKQPPPAENSDDKIPDPTNPK